VRRKGRGKRRALVPVSAASPPPPPRPPLWGGVAQPVTTAMEGGGGEGEGEGGTYLGKRAPKPNPFPRVGGPFLIQRSDRRVGERRGGGGKKNEKGPGAPGAPEPSHHPDQRLKRKRKRGFSVRGEGSGSHRSPRYFPSSLPYQEKKKTFGRGGIQTFGPAPHHHSLLVRRVWPGQGGGGGGEKKLLKKRRVPRGGGFCVFNPSHPNR